MTHNDPSQPDPFSDTVLHSSVLNCLKKKYSKTTYTTLSAVALVTLPSLSFLQSVSKAFHLILTNFSCYPTSVIQPSTPVYQILPITLPLRRKAPKNTRIHPCTYIHIKMAKQVVNVSRDKVMYILMHISQEDNTWKRVLSLIKPNKHQYSARITDSLSRPLLTLKHTLKISCLKISTQFKPRHITKKGDSASQFPSACRTCQSQAG